MIAQPNLTDRPDAAVSFHDVVRARRSIRAFHATPVPEALLASVLAEAQFSPSNCNTQPWAVHMVSGQAREALSRALHADSEAGRFSPDFSWDDAGFSGIYEDRRRAQGRRYYESLGVARDDPDARRKILAANYDFFDAPHVALLFMPVVVDNVRVAGDLGMFAQTLLLSLAAHGLGGVPQTVLGLFADTIRSVLDIPEELKLLFGVSFGYPDLEARANSTRMDRDPFTANVTFHD